MSRQEIISNRTECKQVMSHLYLSTAESEGATMQPQKQWRGREGGRGKREREKGGREGKERGREKREGGRGREGGKRE